MNIKHKSFLITIIACLQLTIFQAQTCDDGYLSTPDELKKNVKSSFISKINNGTILLDNLKSTNQTCWIVYSDRSKNKLLTERGMENGEELDYMEPLVVKEVKEV